MRVSALYATEKSSCMKQENVQITIEENCSTAKITIIPSMSSHPLGQSHSRLGYMYEHTVSVLNCNNGDAWTEATNQTHIIRQLKPAPNNGSTDLPATRLRLSAVWKSVPIHSPSPADQPHLSQFASHPASLTSKYRQPLLGPSSRNASNRADLSVSVSMECGA